MKTLSTLLLSLCMAFGAYAQVQNAMNYQAVARDASGNVLANQSVSFRINILEGSITGTNIYTETHATTTSEIGLATFKIGEGTYVSGTFAGINWADGIYYLKVEMDAYGGNSYVFMGTSRLVSVPFSFRSTSSKLLQDADNDTRVEVDRYGDDDAVRLTTAGTERVTLTSNGNMGIGSLTPAEKLDVTGNVRASGFKYSNPVTDYLTIIGRDMFPGKNTSNAWSSYLGSGQAYMTTETGPMQASVKLPTGATITNVEVHYEDDAVENLSINLQVADGIFGVINFYSFTTSSDQSGVQTDSQAVNYTVNNNGQSYMATIYANPWPDQTVGNRLNFRKMIITYVVNRP